MAYDRFVGIDPDFNFPPQLRSAILLTPEFIDKFNAERTTTNARFVDERDISNAGLASFQNTRQLYTFRWADSAARNAQNGMRNYDQGLQLDTGNVWEFYGTAWRSILSKPKAEIDLLTNIPYGARILGNNGIEYRYNGAKWCPWESAWLTNWFPTWTNANTGNNGGTAGSYRWENGFLSVRAYLLFGSSASVTGPVSLNNLPEPIRNYDNGDMSPIIRDSLVTVKQPSDGKQFVGKVSRGANATTIANLHVEQVTDSFNWLTTFATGQPFSVVQSEQVWIDFKYETSSYPINGV